jgi:hypothetical protein
MRRDGVFGHMLATVLLATVLATSSPSLTPGPEVVLNPFFFRYPSALSIGGTRDALVVGGTTIVGNDFQAFYQVVDSAPHDRVLLTGHSQDVQVVTRGAETLVAWRDANGTETLFPFHPAAVMRHVDNGIFYFAIPTPDGFRVFAHDLFSNVSSVTINVDGSSIGPSIDLDYFPGPGVQTRTDFVAAGFIPSGTALVVTPAGEATGSRVLDSGPFAGAFVSVAANGDSAVFLNQTTISLHTVLVDLAGTPRPAAPQRILISPASATFEAASIVWTGANYLVVWTEKGSGRVRNIRGLLLGDDGLPAGEIFTIAANAEAPAVTGLGRGEAAVAYVTVGEAFPRLILRRLSPPAQHRRAVR